MATTYTTADFAAKLDTDPRTLRKFLRSIDRGVGKGRRHELTGRDIAPLRKQFKAWGNEQAAAKAARAEAKVEADAPVEVEVATTDA